MTDVGEILRGPDYFRCEKLYTRMSKKRCVQRQEMERPDCMGCTQGRKVRGQMSDVGGQRSEIGGQKSEVGGQRSEGEKGSGFARLSRASRSNERLRRGEGEEKKMKMNDKIRDAIENYEGPFRAKDLSGMLGLFTKKEEVQVKNVINQFFMKGKVTKVGRGLYKYNGVPASPEGYAVASPDEAEDHAVASGEEIEALEDENAVASGDPASPEGYAVASGDHFLVNEQGMVVEAPSIAPGDLSASAEKIKVEKELAFDPGKIVEILKDSRFDKLREELLNAAKDQIRTPEAQMVWYVKRGLNLDEMKATASAVAKTERR